MAKYALTGNDNLIVGGRVISDLTDGSTVEISYSNERVGVSTGKNNNTVFAENRTGSNAVMTLRVLRGSSDHSYLNGLSIEQDRDLPSFSLINASFSKRIGDGKGKVKHNIITLTGGAFQNFPSSAENLQGDTEQGTAVFTIIFAQAQETIV